MREIKFRGWSDLFKKWAYGYLVNGRTTSSIIEIYGDIYYNVVPKSVGQFTGLKDKNGKEIYEGDILKDVFDSGTQQVVVYDLDRFIVKGSGVRLSSFATPANIGVIGNIHEHPHLLTPIKQ